jgi:hypothetical protein
MTTPTIAPATTTVAPAQTPKKAPTISAEMRKWEREVYSADPTGGDPSLNY